MELNRDNIIKALEICANEKYCGICRFTPEECSTIKNSTIALIKELTEENERLLARNFELAEKGEKVVIAYKKLSEENERLKNICESYMLQYGTATDKEAFLKGERADTVRKMQERLIAEIENTPNANEFFITAWRTKIDQIAKEMLEGEK